MRKAGAREDATRAFWRGTDTEKNRHEKRMGATAPAMANLSAVETGLCRKNSTRCRSTFDIRTEFRDRRESEFNEELDPRRVSQRNDVKKRSSDSRESVRCGPSRS